MWTFKKYNSAINKRHWNILISFFINEIIPSIIEGKINTFEYCNNIISCNINDIKHYIVSNYDNIPGNITHITSCLICK